MYRSFVTLLVLSITLSAQGQEDGGSKRSNLLNRRSGVRNNIFAKTTTTTTPEPSQDEEEYDENLEETESDDDNATNNEQPAEEPTTTSEAPKVIRPIIRPFRSNDDLLNALKKRQMVAKSSKHAITEKPHNQDKSENRDETAQSGQQQQPTKSAKTTTFNNSRKNRFGSNNKPKVAQEQPQAVEEQPNSTPYPRRAPQSRFSLRPERQT